MERAIIVGSEGQDGRLLSPKLVEQGYAVLGIGRNSVHSTDGSFDTPIRINVREQVSYAIAQWQPAEIYYLAAVNQSSQDASATDDADLFERSLDVHVRGLVNVLEAMKELSSHGALFYAASSLVFGEPSVTPQDENTPFRPRCVYGITKTAGVHTCRYYRAKHHIHASAGLMYNHESPLRQQSFVSQKIVRAVVAAAEGETAKLVLGDLSARVDWANASDVVEAMTRIVRSSQPDEYVIATGELHTVQEFAEIAFGHVGLDWRDYVREDRELLTRPSIARVGNANRLRTRTGWSPTVTFRDMVTSLVDAAKKVHAA